MTNLTNANRVRFGPYEVDLHTRELWKFGTRLKLVGQPFEILAVFVSRPGELITRDDLRERLWPQETFVDFNHGLNAAVNKLRDVLSDSADDPKYIETLPRRGYRFIAKVDRGPEPIAVPPPPPVAVAAEAGPVPTSPQNAHVPHAPGPRVRIPAWAAIAGAAFLVLFLIAYLLIANSGNWWEKRIKHYAEASPGVGSLTKGSQVVVATGGRNEGPQFSPDGTKLVFMSNRSGNGMDLWISNADGSNPKQLTFIGSAGSPRWSPDGKQIAFDSRLNDHGVVLVTDSVGGQPRFVITGGHDNIVPSWSIDGRYLYFASDRTGTYEVWKVSAEGGAPFQITHEGGFAALESLDGTTVYYAKSNKPRPEIWSVPVNGGKEELTSAAIRPEMWAGWAVTERGIFFVDEGLGTAALSAYDINSHRLRQFTYLPKFPFWLGVNRQGTKIAFDSRSDNQSDILEVEDFQ